MSKYDDLINMPYKKSNKRPHMTIKDRSAQFGSFDALTGYQEKIKETARFIEKKRILCDSEIEVILKKLSFIVANLPCEITLTYFEADLKKDGGVYKKKKAVLEKVYDYDNSLVFEDGEKIYISDIFDIESDLI